MNVRVAWSRVFAIGYSNRNGPEVTARAQFEALPKVLKVCSMFESFLRTYFFYMFINFKLISNPFLIP